MVSSQYSLDYRLSTIDYLPIYSHYLFHLCYHRTSVVHYYFGGAFYFVKLQICTVVVGIDFDDLFRVFCQQLF